MDNIVPHRILKQIIQYSCACYSSLLLNNHFRPTNLDSRFLGQCIALVKSEEKNNSSDMCCCVTNLLHTENTLQWHADYIRSIFDASVCDFCCHPPPLLSCNLFFPPTDHPRTPTTGCGGEFGRSCAVSTWSVSSYDSELIIEHSDSGPFICTF